MSNTDNKQTGAYSNSNSCKIKIASDVIARIAGIAALDVDGVAAVSGNLNREAISKCNRNTLKNGVKVMLSQNSAVVDLDLLVGYGYNVPDVCRQVQKKVAGSITSMTGLAVSNVNVSVAGITVQEA